MIEIKPRIITMDEIVRTPAYPLVLFGGAGSGKSTVAARLREEHGFTIFDDDETFSDEEMTQIKGGQRFSMDQRQVYHERTNTLLAEYMGSRDRLHPKVAYINPFAKNIFREQFVERFPKALMVLVEVSWEQHLEQIKSREGIHHTSTELAIQSALGNERPITVPHVILRNRQAASPRQPGLYEAIMYKGV